jgi:hypothetical protein
MPVALNVLDAARQAVIPPYFRRCNRPRSLACVLAVSVSAVTLAAGCGHAERGSAASRTTNTNISARTQIPVPGRALLKPQPEPDCEFKTAEPNTDDQNKLDYERQCYRHAEIIVRNRLQLLQRSVNKTIRAVKRSEQSGS